MRKTLFQILLVSVTLLVSSDVAISRDEDRSPPGIESKMSIAIADLQACQVQPCELQDCQVQGAPVPEVSVAAAPAQDIWLSAYPVERPPDKLYSRNWLQSSETNKLCRREEPDHPFRE